MSVLQAFILGIVQGITEFLPISSSGHLILIPKIFGWVVQDLAFDAVLHLATLAAILVALWGDVRQMIVSAATRTKNDWTRLFGMLLVATIPVIIVGYIFKDIIETALRVPIVVATSLIFWGVMLYLADKKISPHAVDDVKKVGWRSVIAIGLSQAIALIPGTSRSGVTITAGLFTGLNRETAARFSFLLGIPSIALASAAASFDLLTGEVSISILPLLVGFLSAFITGFFAIRFLLRLLSHASYKWFAFYRIALGIIILFIL